MGYYTKAFMQVDTEQKLRKVQRISNVLRRICLGLLVLLALLFLAASTGALVGGDVTIAAFDLRIPVGLMTVPQRLLLIGLLLLSMAVIAKGLIHLYQLFTSYSRGDIFTRQASAQIRQFGITVILWAGVGVILPLAFAVVMHARPSGPFSLHLDTALIGSIIIVISWFMDAAAEMREENELTI